MKTAILYISLLLLFVLVVGGLLFYRNALFFSFYKSYYVFFHSALEAETGEIDMYEVVLNDEGKLRFWLRAIGPTKVVDELVQDAETPERGGWCHLPAHFVAHASYELWGTSLLETRDARCQFGYYHGLLDAHIGKGKTDAVLASVIQLCETFEGRVNRTRCFQGLGEGIAVNVHYDIPLAIEKCKRIPREREKNECFIGVFMKNAFRAYDTFAVAGDDRYEVVDPHYPCNAIGREDAVLRMCHYVQPLIMLQFFDGDFLRVADACRKAPVEYVPRCIRGVGFAAAVPPEVPVARGVFEACSMAPNEDSLQEQCALGGVDMFVFMWGSRFFKEAENFCRRFEEPVQASCLDYLAFLKAQR